MIEIFLADGLTNGRTEVFHEALADLKISPKVNFCKNKGGDKDVGETRNGDKEDNCDLF